MSQAGNRLIDTQYTVETPEGVDLHADLSGIIPRAMAFIVDFCIRALIIALVAFVVVRMGRVGEGILLIFIFLVEWWYPVAFELLKDGQTPGKKMYNIQVVNEDLTPVTFASSLVRNLLRAADFLPFLYFFAIASVMCTKKCQRLGDLAAGTIVIQKAEATNAENLPEFDALPPPVPLLQEEQDALIEFTQRHDSLSQSRQEEIANTLQEVTGHKDNDAVVYLRAVGNWLLGAGK